MLYQRGAERNGILRWGAQLGGLAIVYALGAAQLALYVGPQRAIALGVAPFVVLDLAKLALVAFVPGGIARRLER
jgi:biotin transport system substrate-specific component